MSFFDAIILGLVEGITEFLPVSSTAHLMMAAKILNLPPVEFLKSFEIIIQSGAILAVVVLYWKTLTTSALVWKKIITAFIPTGIVGFLLYKIIKEYLLGNLSLIVWTLGVGGIIFIVFEWWHSRRSDYKMTPPSLASSGHLPLAGEVDMVNEIENMSYSKAFLIGLAQAFAVVPGVSRSGATILAGLALGASRTAIVEFSFLLALPTMLAATGYDLLKNAGTFSGEQTGLLGVGFLVSFACAYFAMKFLLNYVRKNNFTAFGVYRILAAVLFALFVI